MRFPKIDNPLPPLSEFVVTRPEEAPEAPPVPEFTLIMKGRTLEKHEYSVERLGVGNYTFSVHPPRNTYSERVEAKAKEQLQPITSENYRESQEWWDLIKILYEKAHTFTRGGKGVRFSDEYRALCCRVACIDQKAAIFMLTEAPMLYSWEDCGNLGIAFEWREATIGDFSNKDQQYRYWLDINQKLIRMGKA